MPADPNRLLFVLTAHGRTTWAQYREAVDFLAGGHLSVGEETARITAYSLILQCLQVLGHCDVAFTDRGSFICIAPPVFCLLPKAGLPSAVLTGARSPQTFQDVRKAADASKGQVRMNIIEHPSRLSLLPDTIIAESISEPALAKFCTDLGIGFPTVPPAWTLVNWCGTLPEIEAQLDYRYPDNFNWTRYDLNVETLDFVRTTSDSRTRFSRYRNPTTGFQLHVFFDDGHGAEVDLSWGRYVLLNSIKLSVTAYDERRFRLCVPLKVPLPPLIGRTVCLCSGKPPTYLHQPGLITGVNCSDWLMFEDVPPQIAITALSKIGQTSILVDIMGS